MACCAKPFWLMFRSLTTGPLPMPLSVSLAAMPMSMSSNVALASRSVTSRYQVLRHDRVLVPGRELERDLAQQGASVTTDWHMPEIVASLNVEMATGRGTRSSPSLTFA